MGKQSVTVVGTFATRCNTVLRYADDGGQKLVDLAGNGALRGIGMGQATLLSVASSWMHSLGPAHVRLATWTNTGHALPMSIVPWANALGDDGRLLGLSVAVKPAVQRMVPGSCHALQSRFGARAVVCAENHAEFVVCRGDGWVRSFLSSHGVHGFGCFETNSIDPRPEVAALLWDWCDELKALPEVGGVKAQASLFDVLEAWNA